MGATVGLSIDPRPGLTLVSPLVFQSGFETGFIAVVPPDLPRTVDGDLDFSRVDARQLWPVSMFEFDRGVLALRAANPSERARRLTNLVRFIPVIGGRWWLDQLLSESALSPAEVDRVIEEFDRASASAPTGRGR